MFRNRSELLAGFGARAVDAAGGGDQFLQLFRAENIELAVDNAALERRREPFGVSRCAVAEALGRRRWFRPPARRNFAVALGASPRGGLRRALRRRHKGHLPFAPSCISSASACDWRRIRRFSYRIPCHATGRRSASRFPRSRAPSRSCPAAAAPRLWRWSD